MFSLGEEWTSSPCRALVPRLEVWVNMAVGQTHLAIVGQSMET